MKRDSFLIYRSHLDALLELPAEDVKESLRAIGEYAMDGKVPDASGIVMAMFLMMKPVIDANNRKAETRSKRESGTSENMQEQTGTTRNKQEQRGTGENKQELNVKCKMLNEKCKKDNIGRFTPPTPDQVREYASQCGYKIDADRFVDFYESKGWLVGKTKMRDWKAAVRNWARNQKQEPAAKAKKTDASSLGQRYDMEDLEKQLLRAQEEDYEKSG